jgi:CheY-like chemotaxis protein
MVELVFEETRDLPPLFTDEGKLSQILRNLISNALKFTEAGSIRVAATMSDQGDFVVFRVADSGIGIAPENLERIFHEFGQLENPIQQRVKGTGLGLPLSRRLAELLGGTLTVDSTPGVGSTFVATVPRVLSPPNGQLLPSRARQAPEGRPVKVLVVDDEEVARYVFKTNLASASFDVIQAKSGVEGLEKARREAPDVIFLDLIMDDMTGFEVLEELKQAPETRNIPVIILTSKALNKAEREQLADQTPAILSKADTSREILAEQIDRVLSTAGNR